MKLIRTSNHKIPSNLDLIGLSSGVNSKDSYTTIPGLLEWNTGSIKKQEGWIDSRISISLLAKQYN
jgi:hypothetical protein